jgi:hypothetical protein
LSKPVINGDQNQRLFHGTITDLVKAHTHPNGKTLNALDLPLPLASPPPSSRLASDIYISLTNTSTLPHARPYPRSATRWGLAGTNHAFTSFHIDAEGLGTYIQCVSKNGAKWWVLAAAEDDPDNNNVLDFARLFDFYNADKAQVGHLKSMKVEAILLEEGTRL